MLILGIDPALCDTGLAILNTDTNKILYSRTLTTDRKEPIQARLYHIYRHVQQLIETNKIRHAAIETQYMGKYSAALKVAMAYAACLIACESELMEIGHYSPACIKKNITGIGKADKNMVIQAVKIMYPELKKIDSHVADAVALAHVHQQFM